MDFAPTQRKINKPELRTDFGKFYRCMKTKWPSFNEPTLGFSKKPAFYTKSYWNPSRRYTHTATFLRRVKEEIFTVIEKPVRHSSWYKEKWRAIKSLADNQNKVIKKADKGYCVFIWDCMYNMSQKCNSPIKTYISESVLKIRPCVT